MADSKDFVVPGLDPYGSSADVGRLNAETVLRALLAEGPLPRAAIAHQVGLTRATVTRVTGRLIDLGLLREGEPIRPQVGRPLVPLALDGGDRAVATAHFGLREIRVGLVGVTGNVLVERRLPNPGEDPVDYVRVAANSLRSVVSDELGGRNLLGVGACIGGWVNPETGHVVRFNALGWQNVPFAKMLANELDWPLHFDQMVRGIALAEGMFGAARHDRDFVELWLGNIIGAAVVTDGSIRRGASGASGLVGHVPVRGAEAMVCSCGRRGCLGSVASDFAVLDRARKIGAIDPAQTMRDLVDLACAGSPGAIEVITATAGHAGRAATAMVDLLDPSLVVVAGLITEAPQFLPAFRSALYAETEYREPGDPPIVASTFGDAAPTIASASILLDAFYRDPFSLTWAGGLEPGSTLADRGAEIPPVDALL